ncbi:GIY-YIG nuclease family protein [Streptococcus sciuri]|uniref:GIY-YIG nuclease family protein n=1 Tax=Streptococcus sciuri TaxID=2973939 RepID=A0ABT2F7F3_9STRE|nr:GIY-YIG nuclease family protein [Streptococcus sciuri]MCS4487752.1 GIY-YIG nuclease family protein [Streptococcus sciuri]
MSSIRLEDLFNLTSKNLGTIKVKFNDWKDENAVENYLANPDRINNFNLFWRSQMRYFNVGDIAINFIRLENDKWLLTTIKKVTEELGVVHGQNYQGIELAEFAPYFGRLIVKYKKVGRISVQKYDRILQKLEIYQLLPEVYSGLDFKGYDCICLSYAQLASILRFEKKDWLTALQNQKAVYLITDTYTGKLYVGSATSDNGMLLNRWRTYIANGHGGNVALKKLVKQEGIAYVKKNFQYSVLENYNGKIDDQFILQRESWWKEVLKSRDFGYNEN